MPTVITKLTAYCACAVCCGEPDRLTASGKIPVEGITIAAPRSIPLGTYITITIFGYATNKHRVVEDRMSRKRDGWDIFIRSHQRAKKFGVKRAKITWDGD